MKNKNILFFNVHAFESYIFSNSQTLIPNLGLLYISSFLKTRGFVPHVFDMADHDCLDRNYLESLVEKISPLFIGMSVTADNRQRIRRLVSWIKEKFPGLPVVLGGPEATLQRSFLLEEIPADISVIGEGEYSTLELCHYFLYNRKKLKDIPGICSRDRGKIIENEERPLIKNLDRLPFPDYRLIKNKGERNYRYLLITSRGCQFRCSFCAQEVWKHTMRCRSIPNVIRELKWLHREAGGKIDVVVADDCFIINPQRVRQFCRELHKNFIPWENLTWTCEARIDILAANRDLLVLMKQSGLRMLQVGLESADPGQLKKYNKRIKLEEFEAVIRKCAEIGIGCVYFNIILGGPRENREIFLKNLEYVKKMYRLAPGIVECGSPFLALYKSTEISKNPGAYGIKSLDDNIEYTMSMADVSTETEKLDYKEILANKTHFSREIEKTMLNILDKIPLEQVMHIFRFHSPESYYKCLNCFPNFFSYCRRLSSPNTFRLEDNKNLEEMMSLVPSRVKVKLSYQESKLTLHPGYKTIQLDTLETRIYELCAGKLAVADILKVLSREALDKTVKDLEKTMVSLFYKLQENFLVTFSEI